MQETNKIQTKDDTLQLLNIALEHEWAVSFEYIIHAYSMPKAKLFYFDPVLKTEMDARAQTIQIGIDEMYHSLQLGIIIKQMGGIPSYKTDEVLRFPKVIDNFHRDKKTEDLVTSLYQTAEFEEGSFPKIQNMILKSGIAISSQQSSQQWKRREVRTLFVTPQILKYQKERMSIPSIKS